MAEKNAKGQTAAAAVPVYYVRESRVFRGREMNAGDKFDLNAVGCSPVEAATWHAQGLLATAEEMAKVAQIEPGTNPPDGGEGGSGATGTDGGAA